MDAVRKLILDRVEAGDTSLADLSRSVGKNHAYFQQFIHRGVPVELPERVRKSLAQILGVEETDLSISDYFDKTPIHKNVTQKPRHDSGQNAADIRDYISIPEHDVRASAGPGTIVENETEVAVWPLPKEYVRHTLSLRGSNLAIIEVVGDSMEPTLHTGDKILVDLGDKNVAQPGIFALFDGDATVVKRVEKVPGTADVQLISDNSFHSNYRVPAEDVHVAGRVVWFGRRL